MEAQIYVLVGLVVSISMVALYMQKNKAKSKKSAQGKEYEAFLYSLLHGLNNPLTVLINTSSELSAMLKSNRFEAGHFHERIAGIQESTEEIENLSRNILVSSRILGSHGQAHREHILLSDIFASLKVANAEKAARKRQDLVFIAGSQDLTLLADRFFVMTILGNLLDNAIKYSCFDTRITVEWRAASESMGSIIVSDQGPGISDKEKEKLFMRFCKLSALPTGGESSQGLGLYVARELALLSGGKLELLPTAQGAAFELTLPLYLPGKSRIPIFARS